MPPPLHTQGRDSTISVGVFPPEPTQACARTRRLCGIQHNQALVMAAAGNLEQAVGALNKCMVLVRRPSHSVLIRAIMWEDSPMNHNPR